MEIYDTLTRRDFGRLILAGLAGSAFSLTSCKKNKKRKSPLNIPPNVSILRSFKNDGTVDYNIIGDDPDGEVIKIQSKYNDENARMDNGGNVILTKNINKQTNRLEAIAIDNRNAESYTKIDDFEIYSLENARNKIRQMLENARGFKEMIYNSKKIPLYLDDKEILVDFWLIRNDDRHSVINYISLEENLEDELDNKRFADSSFLDNLYLFRLPENEIIRRIQDFINVGYITNFE